MNRIYGLEIVSVIAVTSATVLALSGCSAPSAPVASSSVEGAAPTSEPQCNLGEEFDHDAMTTVARYDAPVSADYYLEHYGPWVANESCTDSQVLAWQQLRRENGESDEICRVVYEYDTSMGRVSPIGCAVPVMVVTDASR
ncbi:hypothetical protein [Microbacterium sp. bgisy207]|jgi:hypothetical protein|uniref:hypothetical protein n=1 Tax=Microbacterium sp. bgisy207 TaxID=3413800 RepID=UPI003EB7F648